MKLDDDEFTALENLTLELGMWGDDERIDFAITTRTAFECLWDMEVRITAKPNQPGPDVSISFYVSGGCDPGDCAEKLLPGVRSFMAQYRRKAVPQ